VVSTSYILKLTKRMEQEKDEFEMLLELKKKKEKKINSVLTLSSSWSLNLISSISLPSQSTELEEPLKAALTDLELPTPPLPRLAEAMDEDEEEVFATMDEKWIRSNRKGKSEGRSVERGERRKKGKKIMVVKRRGESDLVEVEVSVCGENESSGIASYSLSLSTILISSSSSLPFSLLIYSIPPFPLHLYNNTNYSSFFNLPSTHFPLFFSFS